MELKLSTVVVICLFALGVGTYTWALYEESVTGEPFYIMLSTLGALLTISATFGAIVHDWLYRESPS